MTWLWGYYPCTQTFTYISLTHSEDSNRFARMAFCKRCKNSFLDVFRNNTLFIITISAIFVGVALGISLRNANLSDDHIAWITIWGEVFMRMLKAVILPLVATCLIVGECFAIMMIWHETWGHYHYNGNDNDNNVFLCVCVMVMKF